MYHQKILSVAVPISSDKNISSDEDKDVSKGTVNSNTNNVVYQSTELSYELLFKDKTSDHDLAHDYEQMNHEGTISTLMLEVVVKSCVSDWLLGHLAKSQKEVQFVMTQNQAAL